MRIALILAGSLAAVAAFLLGAGTAADVPPAPEQPIAYSHKVHAGDLDMECQYCHTYARRGPVAGLPTVKRCMGCHELVKTESPEIEKLAGYLEREEPIVWNRVYDLRDHTRFYHDRHVNAGVECTTCHGPVATMERMRQVPDLSMGWCIDCHQQREAPLDCLVCHH